MATNDNGINLIDEQQEKNDGRKAFAMGALVALGVTGAMGFGFILRGDGGQTSTVLANQTEPTRIVRQTSTATAIPP